jgi:hypothetical protein
VTTIKKGAKNFLESFPDISHMLALKVKTSQICTCIIFRPRLQEHKWNIVWIKKQSLAGKKKHFFESVMLQFYLEVIGWKVNRDGLSH